MVKEVCHVHLGCKASALSPEKGPGRQSGQDESKEDASDPVLALQGPDKGAAFLQDLSLRDGRDTAA